jgi:hypothetical protein
MSRTVIQVEGLGKRYRIGLAKRRNVLSHVIGDALRAPLRMLGGGSNPVHQEEKWRAGFGVQHRDTGVAWTDCRVS